VPTNDVIVFKEMKRRDLNTQAWSTWWLHRIPDNGQPKQRQSVAQRLKSQGAPSIGNGKHVRASKSTAWPMTYDLFDRLRPAAGHAVVKDKLSDFCI